MGMENREIMDGMNIGDMVTVFGDRERGIIRYGKLMAMRADEKTVGELSDEQVMYVSLRSVGVRSDKACQLIGVDVTMPLVWEAESASGSWYMMCMEGVRKLEADLLEEDMWANVLAGNTKEAERMFALKGRKPQYRDNYQTQVTAVTQVRVSLDNMDFDVSANFKQAEDEKS